MLTDGQHSKILELRINYFYLIKHSHSHHTIATCLLHTFQSPASRSSLTRCLQLQSFAWKVNSACSSVHKSWNSALPVPGNSPRAQSSGLQVIIIGPFWEQRFFQKFGKHSAYFVAEIGSTTCGLPFLAQECFASWDLGTFSNLSFHLILSFFHPIIRVLNTDEVKFLFFFFFF